MLQSYKYTLSWCLAKAIYPACLGYLVGLGPISLMGELLHYLGKRRHQISIIIYTSTDLENYLSINCYYQLSFIHTTRLLFRQQLWPTSHWQSMLTNMMEPTAGDCCDSRCEHPPRTGRNATATLVGEKTKLLQALADHDWPSTWSIILKCGCQTVFFLWLTIIVHAWPSL